MDKVIVLEPGERAVIKLDGVGAVYTVEAIPEPGGQLSTLLFDEVNEEVLDENTFTQEP